MDILQFKQQVQGKARYFKQVFKELKKWDSNKLDKFFHQGHKEAFDEIDCLQCANCCKTTSPRLFSKDIEMMASALKMRPSEFMQNYVRVDEDNDYVFNTTPCPFLGEDNYCKIYEGRPKACREYPHTNRKNMSQILDLTALNLMICPAVHHILKSLSQAKHFK